jgi:predicted hydrocarbon binding protein
MGKLFKRPEEIDEIIGTQPEKESDAILIPNSLIETKLLKNIGNGPELLFVKALETIYKLGDNDDFKYISEEIAKNIFDEVIDNTPLLMWLKDNDLEFMINYLNRLFLTYRLGYVQLHISEEERSDFELFLYDSLIVSFAKKANINEERVCYFYESFFQLLFSKIFGEEMEVKEKFCSIQNDEYRCVFDIKLK